MPINKGYLTAATNKASDEVFTPVYAVKPIVKFLDKKATIWCPFDEEDSNFVKVLKKEGFNVIATHIKDGYNFFDYEPDNYDIIVSNPPFSIKDKILKRINELNKPYALLLPLPTLQGEKRFDYIKGSQALIFHKRIKFIKDKKTNELEKNPPFASIYICKNILPEPIIYEEIKEDDNEI